MNEQLLCSQIEIRQFNMNHPLYHYLTLEAELTCLKKS